jgi:hypothetical protein
MSFWDLVANHLLAACVIVATITLGAATVVQVIGAVLIKLRHAKNIPDMIRPNDVRR